MSSGRQMSQVETPSIPVHQPESTNPLTVHDDDTMERIQRVLRIEEGNNDEKISRIIDLMGPVDDIDAFLDRLSRLERFSIYSRDNEKLDRIIRILELKNVKVRTD